MLYKITKAIRLINEYWLYSAREEQRLESRRNSQALQGKWPPPPQFLYWKDKSWGSFLPYQLKHAQYFLYHNKWVTVILVQSSGMTEEIMEILEKKTENEDSLEQ